MNLEKPIEMVQEKDGTWVAGMPNNVTPLEEAKITFYGTYVLDSFDPETLECTGRLIDVRI